MKRYSFIIPVLVVLCVLGTGSLWFFVCRHTTESAYVDNGRIFNEFKLKKQLETEFKKVESARAQLLDSMLLDLRLTEGKSGIPEKERMHVMELKKQEYLRKQQEFAQANEALTQQYNEQIWKQLNQYVQDYGALNQYDYIFGTMGNGSLMYASKSKDVTDLVIEFVNQRYEGK